MKTVSTLLFVLVLVIGGSAIAGSEASELTLRKVVAARTQILVFESAVDRFYRDVGRYPSSAEGLGVLFHAPAADSARWHGPYLRGELPLDPWAHAYRYRFPGARSTVGFDIWSVGPDGVESDDDVGNWRE